MGRLTVCSGGACHVYEVVSVGMFSLVSHIHSLGGTAFRLVMMFLRSRIFRRLVSESFSIPLFVPDIAPLGKT
jgi:hypothetical protein